MNSHLNQRYQPDYGHMRKKIHQERRHIQELPQQRYQRQFMENNQNPTLQERPIQPPRQWRETRSIAPPPPAAPFPVLPKKDEVLELKKEIDSSIKDCQIELSTLRQASSMLESGNQGLAMMEPDSLGVAEVGGFIISNNLIDSIISQNKKSATLSEQEARIETNHEMMLTIHSPFMVDEMTNHDEMLPLMFTSVFYHHEIEREKEEALAAQYEEIHKTWEKQNDAIDTMNTKEHNFSFRWPEEMASKQTKDPKDENLRMVVAPDIHMLLDPSEKEVQRVWSDTNLVEDPEGEHQKFKSRLRWTDEEKQIFVDKYCAHTKCFSKIASYLPDKTVKDTIEFYYLNKELLDLDGLQAASKRRGSKKRVVTEGAVNKD